MFHDGHELNDIIAEFFDPRENVFGEFRKSAHTILSG